MRALCLGGGAFRGYYQLPVIEYLISAHKYDYIYGVSIGAMNGVMVAQNKYAILQSFWKDIHSANDALKLRWWWPFSGLYSLSPIMKHMNQHVFLDHLKIPFSAGVLSLTDKNYYNLSSALMSSDEELRTAVRASSSIPGLMDLPQLNINNNKHVVSDGGFKNSIPIPPPGPYTDIDVVICTPIHSCKISSPNIETSISQSTRTIEILQDEICQRDVLELQARCTVKPKISIYAPQHDLGPSFETNKELKYIRWYAGLEAIRNPIII
jgi:predicted acylesterase/phospholipase RssA